MEQIIKEWRTNSRENLESNFEFIRSLKMKDESRVDRMAKSLHEKAFNKIDCLKCGNCCKVSSPTLTETDILGLAAHFGKSVEQIKDEYLEQDDGEWIPNGLPCPFFNSENNKCEVYESRPIACQGFPHTNKPRFSTRSHMHSNNTLDCPATFYIVEEMKKAIGI